MDGELRSIFQHWLPEAHWNSIESGLTSAGLPDAEYCFPLGLCGWMEFKRTKPKSPNSVVIRPPQATWAEYRLRKGGRIHLAVRQKHPANRIRGALDALYLYHGRDMRAVLENGLQTPPLRVWDGGPAHWGWGEIRQFLTV